MPIFDHVGNLEVFHIDDIVLPYQCVGFLVVEVLSLPSDRLVAFRQLIDGFLAPLTAFLATAHLFLLEPELLFHLAQPARVGT